MAGREKAKREVEMKRQGLCPYSGLACRHTRVCIMGKIDACYRLVACIEAGCWRCKLKAKKCKWACFRHHKGLV